MLSKVSLVFCRSPSESIFLPVVTAKDMLFLLFSWSASLLSNLCPARSQRRTIQWNCRKSFTWYSDWRWLWKYRPRNEHDLSTCQVRIKSKDKIGCRKRIWWYWPSSRRYFCAWDMLDLYIYWFVRMHHSRVVNVPGYAVLSFRIGNFERFPSQIPCGMRCFFGHNVLIVYESWNRIILKGIVKYQHDHLLRLLQLSPRRYT